jgi:DUF917 family protein
MRGDAAAADASAVVSHRQKGDRQMRELDAEQLKDVARGAAILGTGGGGDPYLGTLAALRALEEFGPPKVIDPDELPDNALVAVAGIVGALVPLIEKFSFGPELDEAYRALDRVLNGRLFALMSPEMGGVNSVVSLVLGARLGIPVVDADAKGRAYPEIEMATMTLYGIQAAPYSLADEHGNSIIINGVNNRWVERIARTACVEFGAICAGLGFPMTGRQLREAAVLRTLSYAEEIGRGIREAQERKADPIGEITRITGGYVLFRGKIVDVQRRTMKGWSLGEAMMEGLDEFAGSQMHVSFQNENLVAQRNGEICASVPDLITIIDSESGEAITTERLRYGFRVIVLGIPCNEKWRTDKGVELGGPSHFHYDFEYVPIEQLNERMAASGYQNVPS